MLGYFNVSAQSKKQNEKSIYTKEYEQVKTNSYLKHLASKSETKLNYNWNNYQGGEIHTTDSLFMFNNELLCHSFPTNSDIIRNDQLIIYFSQKTAKCPTLFSWYKHYKPLIDSQLIALGLPKELSLIPAVCSAFNPYSDNGIGGKGYWHLNHPQAVRYGLNINTNIDERRDIQKSSKAAAKYLKDLYSKYQNWELTLTAYSSGVVTVAKLLKRHNANSYKEIQEYLPSETKDFVQSFVAMNYIYNYDSYGVVELNPILKFDTINIERKLKFKAIKDVIGIKIKDLSYLNHTLLKEEFPNNFNARLPLGIKDKLLAMKDSIYFYQDSILLRPTPKEPEIVIPKNGEPIEYRVKSGDVLGSIAQRFGVRVSQLQAWNNIDGTRINVGQKLMIYGKSSKNKSPSKPETHKNKTVVKKDSPKPKTKEYSGKYSTYTVKSGDNLWIIAKKYSGVSADNIMEFNNIDASLDVGQVLKIPKP
jgi:membrane-bound lytic murein transglycosylase D